MYDLWTTPMFPPDKHLARDCLARQENTKHAQETTTTTRYIQSDCQPAFLAF